MEKQSTIANNPTNRTWFPSHDIEWHQSALIVGRKPKVITFKIYIPTAKSNTRNALPVSQDKFDHVGWNYFWSHLIQLPTCITAVLYNYALRTFKDGKYFTSVFFLRSEINIHNSISLPRPSIAGDKSISNFSLRHFSVFGAKRSESSPESPRPPPRRPSSSSSPGLPMTWRT